MHICLFEISKKLLRARVLCLFRFIGIMYDWRIWILQNFQTSFDLNDYNLLELLQRIPLDSLLTENFHPDHSHVRIYFSYDSVRHVLQSSIAFYVV
jgi:hypothetical protein